MKRISLANLPTKIQKLERLSKELNTNIYIKRDDQTGSEYSGNKVRKLEYCVADAKSKGANLLITCGGIQSNHCRATVAVATLLGMKSAVLLRISDKPPVTGNYFLDKLMGADVKFCTKEEYSKHRGEIMDKMAEEYKKRGYKPYVIPEGASNDIGTLGYYNCLKEIVKQEKEMNIKFDTIVVATGSGGTYSGLYLANEIHKYGKRIIGMAVCDNNEYFTNIVKDIATKAIAYLPESLKKDKNGKPVQLNYNNIEFEDKYVGIGYALSRPEELEFIKKIARLEGLVLDPVYTGKAMYGIYNELKDNGILTKDRNGKPYPSRLSKKHNILFIHTGGLYGLFPVSETFSW
jgi:pyridoxal phosphate-dependent enzymes, D-cysteine desulfhydrase family